MNKNRLIIGILSVLFIAIVVLYALGYRIGDFGIGKAQKVIIKDLPEETQVFLGNKSIGFKSGDVDLLLAPGVHSIILSKAGFWPYIENIELTEYDKSQVVIRPFFFLQNPSGVLIGSNDSEYGRIISLFNRKSLPTEESPIVSTDKSTEVYIEGGKIVAKWVGVEENRPKYFDEDTKMRQVFNPVTEVRAISFYKDRPDVMIVAMQDGIFALEIDPTGTQNLQPILEGSEPDFRVDTDGKLYARDENSLMLLSI